jgi:hypothetical protein
MRRAVGTHANSGRRAWSTALGLWLLGWPLQVPAAELAGTAWLMRSSSTLWVTDLVHETTRGYTLVKLGSDNYFELRDPAGRLLRGTWEVDARGNVSIVHSSDDLDSFVWENLPPYAGSQASDIDVETLQSEVSVTQKNGVATLAFEFGLTLTFELPLVSDPLTLKYWISGSGKQDLADGPPVGSQWMLECELETKAGHLAIEENQELQLRLGPDGELDANRFRLQTDDDDVLYSGSYVQVGRLIRLLPETGPLRRYFVEKLTPLLEPNHLETEIFLERVIPSYYAKITDGELRVNARASFPGSFDLENPETGELLERRFRGRHALKCEGAPLVPSEP